MTIRTICHMIYAGTDLVPAFVYGKEQAMEDGLRVMPRVDFIIIVESGGEYGPMGITASEDKLDEIISDRRISDERWITISIRKNGRTIRQYPFIKRNLRGVLETTVDQLMQEAMDA